MLPRPLTKLCEAQLRVLNMASHGEIGAIDLQHDAGIDDAFIFDPHRFGDRMEIAFLVRIVIVAKKQRDHTRRCGAHEGLATAVCPQRRRQVADVGLRRPGIAHADRRVAGRRLAA
jgi:hypothetical protein